MIKKINKNRREFVKKGAKTALLLSYVIPAIETILILNEEAYGREGKGVSCPKRKKYNPILKKCICPPNSTWHLNNCICNPKYVWKGNQCKPVV